MFTNLVYRISFVFTACVSTTDNKKKLQITDGLHGSNEKAKKWPNFWKWIFIFVTHVLVYEKFY